VGSVRRSPRDPSKWEALYRDPGGRQRSKRLATKGEAKAWLTRVEADMDHGRWQDPRLARIKFNAWVDQYLAAAVHLRPTTRAAIESSLRRHLRDRFGNISLGDITPLLVRTFVSELSQHRQPDTVRTVYGHLRSILNAAVAADIIAVSPCRGVKLPTKRPSEKKVITLGELGRLADAVGSDYRAMILIAGILGLRWSEVTALRVGRVDLLRRTMSIVETNPAVGDLADTKSRSSRRTLTIPQSLAGEIAAHLARQRITVADPDRLVFTSERGGRLVGSNFNRRHWQPALKAAGITGFTFHGLRHSAVAYMVAAGAHPKAIQQRLGHSSWSTTMDIYGHVLPANDDTLTAALDRLLKPESSNPTDSRGLASVRS